MKSKLLRSCVVIGTPVAVMFALLILSTSYSKSFHGYHISPHQAFKITESDDEVDITSRGLYIPPPEHSVRLTPHNETITEATSVEQIFSNRSRIIMEQTSYSSYMLALHTAEQLTMSTSHFVEFMNLVYQWNMTGVEPVVYGSRMNGLRSMHMENIPGSLHYRMILNTSLMRQKLSECLNGRKNISNTFQLFAPLSVFVRQSMRAITLVYFTRHISVLGKQLHASADALIDREKNKSGLRVFECTNILRESGVSSRAEDLLNRELIIEGADVENFTVVQAFCIRKVEMSLVKLRDEILASIHRDKESNEIDVSIVFVSWQGKFTRPFTDMKTLYRCRLPSSQIEPSQHVIAASNKFLKSLGLKKQSYIAIHIRFEKLFRAAFSPQKDSRHFLDCCMLKLNALLKQVKELNNFTSEGSTLLLHDYGNYGTDACQHGGWKSRSVCVNESRYLLSLLNETRASEFDPIKFGAPQNPGFVSLVEGLSLSEGHSLVVIGGGSFQVSIAGRYADRIKREHAKSGTVYSICTGRENVHNLELGEIKECT